MENTIVGYGLGVLTLLSLAAFLLWSSRRNRTIRDNLMEARGWDRAAAYYENTFIPERLKPLNDSIIVKNRTIERLRTQKDQLAGRIRELTEAQRATATVSTDCGGR